MQSDAVTSGTPGRPTQPVAAAEVDLARASAVLAAVVQTLVASGIDRAAPAYSALAEAIRQLRTSLPSGSNATLGHMAASARRAIDMLQGLTRALVAIEAAVRTDPTSGSREPVVPTSAAVPSTAASVSKPGGRRRPSRKRAGNRRPRSSRKPTPP